MSEGGWLVCWFVGLLVQLGLGRVEFSLYQIRPNKQKDHKKRLTTKEKKREKVAHSIHSTPCVSPLCLVCACLPSCPLSASLPNQSSFSVKFKALLGISALLSLWTGQKRERWCLCLSVPVGLSRFCVLSVLSSCPHGLFSVFFFSFFFFFLFPFFASHSSFSYPSFFRRYRTLTPHFYTPSPLILILSARLLQSSASFDTFHPHLHSPPSSISEVVFITFFFFSLAITLLQKS